MSMGEGSNGEWLVADGDQVAVGQPLYLLETDKTQNEVPSPVAGIIKLIGQAGETYDVGTIIAEVS
jgi:pyruvate/2-oxoglutarate dehydrogenase complex dihydrolipoamide acyltransferase (E2) component